MSDLLIFDILLLSGGLRQPDTLWPPTDPKSLCRLLDAIEDSTYGPGCNHDCGCHGNKGCGSILGNYKAEVNVYQFATQTTIEA